MSSLLRLAATTEPLSEPWTRVCLCRLVLKQRQTVLRFSSAQLEGKQTVFRLQLCIGQRKPRISPRSSFLVCALTNVFIASEGATKLRLVRLSESTILRHANRPLWQPYICTVALERLLGDPSPRNCTVSSELKGS